jgi:hypothetical protein
MIYQRGRRDSRPPLSGWAKGSLLIEIFRNRVTLLRSVLSEIFDESAYARFLSRHGLASSCESYAAFLRESEHVKARRPRCC